MAAQQLTAPRSDPTSREAIARVERRDGPGLHVSIGQHVACKGGHVAEAFVQAGFVTMAEAGG